MIVGTAVPSIIVGPTDPTMIVETNISLEAVPTTLVGIAVLTSIVVTTIRKHFGAYPPSPVIT